MNSDEKIIKNIFSELGENNTSDGYKINHRIAKISKFIFDDIGGHVVEIGAGEGYTTKNILKYDIPVLVIDPFESGFSYIDEKGYNDAKDFIEPYPLDKFLELCGMFSNMTLVQECSQKVKEEEILSKIDHCCFAIVDGLQVEPKNVYDDLILMEKLNPKVISVDDYYSGNKHRRKIVQEGVNSFLDESNYELINTTETYPDVRECYLLRKDK